MKAPAILLPCDPLASHRPDGHFVGEAVVARDLGGVVALVDLDALLAGDTAGAVRRVPPGLGGAWYRGWMVPVAAYAALSQSLDERGCTLLTTPAGYAAAHELPGWYDVFDGATPLSTWLPGTGVPSPEALAAAAQRIGGTGPAVVKDYVKSRKHEWDEACFIPALEDTAALHRVVSRFVELQAEFLTGGVVLRAYEPFDGSDASDASDVGETRVWWVDGDPVLLTPHPDNPLPAGVPLPVEPDLTVVHPLVRTLGCRFISTDLARRSDDGSWRVVEVGDGQVSGLPRGADPAPLLAALIAS